MDPDRLTTTVRQAKESEVNDGRLLAHRGMPGALQNTREGVRQALALGYRGIEIDLVLTSDGVPILSHDPWLHPEYVSDGGEDEVIWKMTWAAIQAHSFSGQTPLALGELFDIVGAAPGVALYLDVKVEEKDEDLTARADAYAEAIFSLVEEHRFTNPLMIEAQSREVAAIYRARRADGYEMYLSWPRYAAQKSAVLTTLMREVTEALGIKDAVESVQKAGVVGYSAPKQIVEGHEIDEALEAGVEVVIFGSFLPDKVRELRRPGVHLIADHQRGLPI